ncbi:hypothetical protein PALI_a1276 [Pseudoalteromonas aliena SW19]|uniref:Uncharacterized protein n=1 Tax=Pseudoalteromonas aliena SW19 TaxID=1314866 RepID=A0ABR9E006_9GAMM|nr:hypothetical protein [Pseudoalteromonas aliena SW19]
MAKGNQYVNSVIAYQNDLSGLNLTLKDQYILNNKLFK